MKTDFDIRDTELKGKALFTKRRFKKGDLVLSITGERIDQRNMYTVEIGKDIHIEPSNEVKYLTHSCDPNLGVRNNTDLIALRDIEAEEEINFDYAMTEYVIASPFICTNCSMFCRGNIGGFKTLPEEFKTRYKGYISAHLLSQ